MDETPEWPGEAAPEDSTERESPSPWPATLLVFVGGALAVASIRLENYAVDFGACACLVIAWRLSDALDAKEWPGHPLARKSTRMLLVAFATIAGLVGALRLTGRF